MKGFPAGTRPLNTPPFNHLCHIFLPRMLHDALLKKIIEKKKAAVQPNQWQETNNWGFFFWRTEHSPLPSQGFLAEPNHLATERTAFINKPKTGESHHNIGILLHSFLSSSDWVEVKMQGKVDIHTKGLFFFFLSSFQRKLIEFVC